MYAFSLYFMSFNMDDTKKEILVVHYAGIPYFNQTSRHAELIAHSTFHILLTSLSKDSGVKIS